MPAIPNADFERGENNRLRNEVWSLERELVSQKQIAARYMLEIEKQTLEIKRLQAELVQKP